MWQKLYENFLNIFHIIVIRSSGLNLYCVYGPSSNAGGFEPPAQFSSDFLAEILYIKMLGFVCLFVCLFELIEELASRRDTKIGM